MRSLQRVSKPNILVRKERIWTTKIMLNPKKRPSTSTYRHTDILDALKSTSFHKCFYCETILIGSPNEVDHHIEFDIDPSLAVNWDNLYLSCVSCNNKLNHSQIPITKALDPCRDSDSKIQEHIYFEDEIVLPRNNSIIGTNTIQKYKLGSDNILLLRTKEIKNFFKLITAIMKRCVDEGRPMSTDERQLIESYTYIEKSYSLMFIDAIKSAKLLV